MDKSSTGVQPQTGKQPPQPSQTPTAANVVDRVLKNKNRFRAGLGFKEKRGQVEDKMRIAQNVSKKKILQGTKGDRENKQDDDRDDEIPKHLENKTNDIENGPRNHLAYADADEDELVSAAALKKKSKYIDPRTAFLEQIQLQEKTSST